MQKKLAPTRRREDFECEALRLILDRLIDNHPNISEAHRQIDDLIACLKSHANASNNLDAEDPLLESVIRIRAAIGINASTHLR